MIALTKAFQEELYPVMNGRANSVSGTMVKHQYPPQQQQQPIYVMAAHPQTLPYPKFMKHHGNTFSHRPRGRMLVPARPIAPPLLPVAAPVIISTTMPKNKVGESPPIRVDKFHRFSTEEEAAAYGRTNLPAKQPSPITGIKLSTGQFST